MDCTKNTLLKEIAETLKSTSFNEDCNDLLDADIQEVKDKIRTTINNHIYQLRIREQWLLQHTDHLYEYMNHILKDDAEKLAEMRGKLQCCADIGQNMDLKDSNLFYSYALETLQAYKKLSLENQHYSSGSICFAGDDGKLIKSIRKFGKVINAASTMCEEGSDAWEFPEVETISNAPEMSEGSNGCGVTCSGNCTNMSFEIEDINKHFEQMRNPVIPLSDVCKANEVCSSIKECLCDEPCHVTAPEDQSNRYVAQIEMAFRNIARFGDESKMKRSEQLTCKLREDVSDEHGALDRFNQQIADLQQQFAHINDDQSNLNETQFSDNLSVATPPSVGLASTEIANIVKPTKTSEYLPKAISNPLDDLMSEINAIVNGELPMYGVLSSDDLIPKFDFSEMRQSSLKENPTVTPVYSSDLVKLTNVFKNSHINDSEKNDKEKNYAADSKTWCTVEDMQEILTGILRS